jgi:hypothetical protein
VRTQFSLVARCYVQCAPARSDFAPILTLFNAIPPNRDKMDQNPP